MIVGGQEGPLVDSYATAATLALFDVDTNRWMADFDIDGSLPRRIGHSAITIDQRAYVFGGESLDEVQYPVIEEDGKTAVSKPLVYDDVHRLSFAKGVLRCERVGEMTSDNHAGDADATAGSAVKCDGPIPRAWHASTAIRLSVASETPENPTTSHGMLVLGGKDASGTVLGDAWMLTVDAEASSSWESLSVWTDD